MEYNNAEVAVIEVAVTQGFEMQVRELDDLQLAMVGGGGGEASFG